MYIVRIERRMERILTRPCAARSTLVYLERGGVPRCTKSVESVNQASWRGKWCPGEVLDPSHKQRCIIWNAWCEILHILRQLNAEPCPAWTTERGKLKRGWSPGDSLNLVRVLSVRVNYSQQCRNDINGRWEYSKSIIRFFHVPSKVHLYTKFEKKIWQSFYAFMCEPQDRRIVPYYNTTRLKTKIGNKCGKRT